MLQLSHVCWGQHKYPLLPPAHSARRVLWLSSLASQTRQHPQANKPKLFFLHTWTSDAASLAGRTEHFIIVLISSERSQAVVNPSFFLVTCSSFESASRGRDDACPQRGVWLQVWRAAAEPHEHLGSHEVGPSTLSGVMGCGCVVEGGAASVIDFSFMHS